MTDRDLVDLLCVDEVFKESIEEEYGRIKRIYPDWQERILIYHFIDDSYLHSDLDQIIKIIKEVGYEKQFLQ